MCLLILVVHIICRGSSWLLWAALDILPMYINVQAFVLGMLGENNDFFFAWVKIKTYNWMELLPPSTLVLASLTMKIYYPLSSPISIHSCFKTMSRIPGSLLSK